MPKRSGPSDAQKAAVKRGREAAAETLRLRNAAAGAAPVANPPPASTTASSSAVAPSDNVTMLGTMAVDDPAASSSEAMETGGNDAPAPVANPPAAAPVASGTAAAPFTGGSSSTDAPSAVAPAGVTVSLPVADDDDEPRECPGVSRASVVAGEKGGQIYARDVVSAPPNQLGGALTAPSRAGKRPATSVDEYRTDKAGNVRTVWAKDRCAPSVALPIPHAAVPVQCLCRVAMSRTGL